MLLRDAHDLQKKPRPALLQSQGLSGNGQGIAASFERHITRIGGFTGYALFQAFRAFDRKPAVSSVRLVSAFAMAAFHLGPLLSAI